MVSSVRDGGNRFRKVKNFSAMHRLERKGPDGSQSVNEDSGYRKFGGCLNAGTAAYAGLNRMATSEQSLCNRIVNYDKYPLGIIYYF